MKVVASAIAVLTIVGIAYFTYCIVAAPKMLLYPKILAMHTNPLLRPKEHGNLPCLYVSRFYYNSRDGGTDYALYGDNSVIVRRITRSGVQGGSGPVQDYLELQALKQLSSLPQGLSSPNAVPHERLLIVSLHHGSWWKTYYYDRQNLPPQVKPVEQISNIRNI